MLIASSVMPLTANAGKICIVKYGNGNLEFSQNEASFPGDGPWPDCPEPTGVVYNPFDVAYRSLPTDPTDFGGLTPNGSFQIGGPGSFGPLSFSQDMLLGGRDLGTGNLEPGIANGGVWEITSDADVLKAYPNSFTSFANLGPGGGVIEGAGVFRKSGGTGITTVDIPFGNQGGIIDVQTGVIDFTNTAPSSFVNSLALVDYFGSPLPPTNIAFIDTIITGAGEVRISADAVIGFITTASDTTLAVNGQATWSEANSQIAGTLTNNGTIILVEDNVFAIDPNIILEAGSTFINFGTITGNGRIAVDPGATFENRGIFAPGNSPGRITIDGAYAQSPEGQLILEIAGINSGEFDVLEVLGTATFGVGTDIVFQFIDGFAPSMGDSFDVLLANLFVGDLSLINYIILGLEPGFDFDVDFTNGTFTMTALNDGVASLSSVPIPGAVWLFGSGLLGLIGMARSKKAA